MSKQNRFDSLFSDEEEALFKTWLGPQEIETIHKKMQGIPLTNAEHQAWLRLRNRLKIIEKLEQEAEALRKIQQIISPLIKET